MDDDFTSRVIATRRYHKSVEDNEPEGELDSIKRNDEIEKLYQAVLVYNKSIDEFRTVSSQYANRESF
jgi:hypothetical protein